MLWSKAFIPTLKEIPQEAETASHKLILRAGLARMLISGVYSYLPLGFRVLNNIIKIIREEMNACGAAELLLPSLQPQDLWIKTGRDREMGETIIRFIDRKSRKLCLGPTHEEVITDLAKSYINSYKQLPFVLYQIQTKFRDEPRPRFGLMRSCEFIMKDAYSFDKDEAGLELNYRAMYEAYRRIFSRMKLEFLISEADSGVMGGKVSHEFMVPAGDGEDTVFLCKPCGYTTTDNKKEVCPKCQKPLQTQTAIELAHIFKLGTKYSDSLQLKFIDADGKSKAVIMGCYGIGVSRIIQTIVEKHRDADGIIWPASVSPYLIEVLPLNIANSEIFKSAFGIYEQLQKNNTSVLIDDRAEYAGRKFKDADLIGFPICIVIGEENIKQGLVEIKLRKDKKTYTIKKEQLFGEIERLINVIP